MRNQQQLTIFLILCVYFIQIHYVISTYLKEISLSKNILHNCPIVKNDENVVELKYFKIPLNPITRNLNSYGTMDENGNIIHLKIINEKFIPPTIFGLKNLKRLQIYNTCFYPCKHSIIPSRIKCLASSLIELKIHGTNITYLSKDIGELKYLQILILSNTGLKFISDAIGHLSSLNVFSLQQNNLTSLPNTMKNLFKLKRIILSKNPQLSSLEPLNDLPNLEYLDARECSITILPRNLPLLDELHMSANKLKTLKDIQTLGYGTNNGKFFYFDMNKIVYIPTQICQMKNLTWLKLNQNQLTDLPMDIFSVTTLRYLDIKKNLFSFQTLRTIVSEFNRTNPNLNIDHDE